MIKLEQAGFPSKYLDCYESALMAILKYMGLLDETPLMGTQAYFVLKKEHLSVYPRFHLIHEEWKRIHGLVVKTVPVDDETDLQSQIEDRLGSGMPVCLTTDIYFLPHTSYHERLHQMHFIDVFGYDDERYYTVCPYYRFEGWMSKDVLHTSFLSPATESKCLMFVPELKCEALSADQVHNLVRENCEYMLGLVVPEEQSGTDPRYLGLAGIRTYSAFLQELAASPGDLPNQAAMLSAQTMAIGYSRYWFHRLLKESLPADVIDVLEIQFTDVVRSWKATGARFGAAVLADNREMMKRAARRLEDVYEQEYQVSNYLLGALPDYEEGKF